MSLKKYCLLLIGVAFLAASCKKQVVVKKNDDLQRVNAGFKVENANFIYLTSKAKMSYKDDKQEVEASVDIRMKKDSLIWLSVRVMLGIEVARVLITKDSVYMNDKLNRQMTVYDFKTASQKLKFDVDFSLIESLIIGNMPEYASKNAKMRKEESFFVLEKQEPDKQIWSYVSTQNFKLTKIEASNSAKTNTLNVDYSDFKPLEKLLLPHFTRAKVSYTTPEKTASTEAELTHQKIEFPKELKFPFKN